MCALLFSMTISFELLVFVTLMKGGLVIVDRQNLLAEQLSLFGINCSDTQASLLLRLLDLVIEKNKSVNLTRITNPIEAITLHIVDSLLPLACPCVSLTSGDHFVDIGTGAGFPGIPLAILSGATGVLVDSIGKKVNAVKGFIQTLGLSNVSAQHMRIEDVGSTILANHNLVFTRAVEHSNVLLEYAAPLLKFHGLVVLEKARPDRDEISAALRASDILGLTFVSRETFDLPNGLGHREILLFQKTGRSRIQLPRRAGLAKADPLGLR